MPDLEHDSVPLGELTKHTPGPWSVPHFAEPDVNCECGYVLTDHLMGAVCTVHASGEGDDWQKHGDNPRFAEAVANAHLIAAAPDMLAALRRAERFITNGIELGYIRIPSMPDPAVETPGIIRAAIAKAEGGAA